jgi:hypothetical protein
MADHRMRNQPVQVLVQPWPSYGSKIALSAKEVAVPEKPEWYKFPTNFSRTESRGSLDGLRPEITSKLDLIRQVFQQYAGADYPINITAGQEWNPKHGLFSLHHTGFAVDIRTRDLRGGGTGYVAKQIARALTVKLGEQYYVLLHQPPDPPHIHIQYRRGIRVSSPGDFPLQYA